MFIYNFQWIKEILIVIILLLKGEWRCENTFQLSHIGMSVPITDVQLQLRLYHTEKCERSNSGIQGAIVINDHKWKDDTKRFDPGHHEIQRILLLNWKRILRGVPRNVYQCK